MLGSGLGFGFGIEVGRVFFWNGNCELGTECMCWKCCAIVKGSTYSLGRFVREIYQDFTGNFLLRGVGGRKRGPKGIDEALSQR